jgi:predicted dehydrogenase
VTPVVLGIILVYMAKLTGVPISCGAIARAHLAALTELDDVEISAVCHLSAARAEPTAERFGVAKWHTNRKQLLKEIHPNFFHIAIPPSAYFSLAPAASEA